MANPELQSDGPSPPLNSYVSQTHGSGLHDQFHVRLRGVPAVLWTARSSIICEFCGAVLSHVAELATMSRVSFCGNCGARTVSDAKAVHRWADT